MKQIITIIAVCLLTASCTNSKVPNGTASSNAQTSDTAAPGAAGKNPNPANTTTAADGSIPHDQPSARSASSVRAVQSARRFMAVPVSERKLPEPKGTPAGAGVGASGV